MSNDCDDQVDEGGVCPAGCSAKQRGGHVYLLCIVTTPSQQPSYDEATMRCAEAGAMLDLGVTLALARVESMGENDFIKTWIVASTNESGMVWFGANDIEQENRWVWGRGSGAPQFFTGRDQGGGTPYQGAFDDFADGRPNSGNTGDEDCGAFDSDFAWQWNDLVCAEGRLGYICEQTDP